MKTLTADSRKKTEKKCGVCGDNALGSNFNAITCESCKAFFRRNALKTKDFKCPFDGNCKVEVLTRRFCQRCRLKKCFEIGMKKEWIMSEEQKIAKRKKIEKNRQKRGVQQESECPAASEQAYVKLESPEPVLLSPASTMSPLTPQTPTYVGVKLEKPSQTQMLAHQPLTPSDCEYSPPSKIMIMEETAVGVSIDSEDGLTTTDKTYDDTSQESYRSEQSIKEGNETSEDLHDTTHGRCTKSAELSGEDFTSAGTSRTFCYKADGALPDSVYRNAIAVQFAEIPLRNSSYDPKQLSSLEQAKLNELVVANRVLKMPLACGISDPSLLDVINMTDHAIRRLIKMSKKILVFKNLCQGDQIALLKGGCTELMILRSVMSYDPEKDCWQGPQGPRRMSIKVDVLKKARGNVYEEHKRFINSFLPEWRADENIMLILSGIALFTPERPNVVHKEVIKLEQDTYYYLLLRYLETKHSACNAKSYFLKLSHRIEELHILNENHVRVYLDVNPKDVEPLLIEIFDLNH